MNCCTAVQSVSIISPLATYTRPVCRLLLPMQYRYIWEVILFFDFVIVSYWRTQSNFLLHHGVFPAFGIMAITQRAGKRELVA